MSDTLLLIMRALLLAASFTGLVAAVRSETGLDRFIAPFFTASGVIVILMLAGMANVLRIAFYLLYAAGYVGLVLAYGIRRKKPDLPAIGLMAAFLLFLIWRMYPVKLFSNDDLSHWGLVARHLLIADAFPDASAGTVMFQSYPLGSAAFIYYFVRTLENSEGMWLVASEFLYGLSFLPVLSHIHRNKTWSIPILAGVFFYNYGFMRQYGSLRVDGLLGFYGLGIVAAATYYHSDFKKAALAVSMPILAVVYLKNSGLFFAAVGAFILAWNAVHQYGKRRMGAAVFAAVMGAAVCAYVLWTLHVRVAFPVGMETKHAVSLANFAQRLKEKDAALILTIAKKMCKRVLKPNITTKACLLFVVICTAFESAVALLRPRLRTPAIRSLRLMLFGFMIYGVWMVMLFLMYVFSMPKGEAEKLASYSRYINTAGILLTGIAGITLVDLLEQIRLHIRKGWLLGMGTGTLALVLIVLLLNQAQMVKMLDVFNISADYSRERKIIREAQNSLGFPNGGNYLFYWQRSETKLYSLHYFAKYEYNSMSITLIVHDQNAAHEYGIMVASPARDDDKGTGHEAVLRADSWATDDPLEFLQKHIGDYDAVIVGDQDELFEKELEEVLSSMDNPPLVYYAWQKN